MNKIKVGLIYGGESFEHDVSLMTAESIRKHIDVQKFDVTDIFISKTGELDEKLLDNIDIAFLAVHGPNCEDGKLQKYLEDRGVKYTGPGVRASEINLNKVEMHDVFKKAGIPTVEYRGFSKDEISQIKPYVEEIGLPVFIKPNNAGSSVGVNRVDNINDLDKFIDEAFKYDDIICVEKGVSKPREIEVAVLGNDDLVISAPGEILTHGEVYSYDTKYLHPFNTTTDVENLTQDQRDKIRKTSEMGYRAIGFKGYARMDFLLNDKEIYLNEITALPGFTSISMFPKLMEAGGIAYKDLITKIIELGMEK